MPQFQPGDPKPLGSGRQKGTPNKRKIQIQKELDALVLDYIMPTMPAVIDAMRTCQDPYKCAHIFARLLGYSLPRGGYNNEDDEDKRSFLDMQLDKIAEQDQTTFNSDNPAEKDQNA